MASFIAYWLRWPSVEYLLETHTWLWPLCEIFHFVGLILLIGAVGTFDLRLIGFGKGLWVQLKLTFITLAGLNLTFHLSGMARVVETLGPEDDTPVLARCLGGISLALWLGVIYVGRLIAWEL